MLVASAPKARLHLAAQQCEWGTQRLLSSAAAEVNQLKLKQMTMKMAQSDPIWSK